MSTQKREPSSDEKSETTLGRRDALKGLATAATATTMGAALSAAPAAAQTTSPPATNPYGAPPGSGVSMPPYYRPTPSIKNRNNFFAQTEELGADEMRITFMGSNPFPPRLNQAGTCIMVELGNGSRLFFDFGSGCMRNIVGMQVPIPEVNDIFLSHLHIDHYADLPYLYGFGPSAMRWKPLRVIGPSGRTPEFGTAAMIKSMQQMGRWHTQAFMSLPVGDGYEVDVTEFDYKDDHGICYNKNGVTVRHWRRSHTMDGASAYRLDWNGLSFVWTRCSVASCRRKSSSRSLRTPSPTSKSKPSAIWRSSRRYSPHRIKSADGSENGRLTSRSIRQRLWDNLQRRNERASQPNGGSGRSGTR